MGKTAIFVSDLHLGRGDELEDFVPENEAAFVQFLGRQSEKYMGHELDLVLLGDSLDIWQVATDQEKTALESKDIEITLTGDAEMERVQQVVSKHANTFAVLGRFLKADPKKRRNVIVPGNHDHSLIRPDVQRVIREATALGDANVRESILFPYYYDEPDLCTYAEHGNQYDVNNDYDDFAAFGPECPGYYFVLSGNKDFGGSFLSPCVFSGNTATTHDLSRGLTCQVFPFSLPMGNPLASLLPGSPCPSHPIYSSVLQVIQSGFFRRTMRQKIGCVPSIMRQATKSSRRLWMRFSMRSFMDSRLKYLQN